MERNFNNFLKYINFVTSRYDAMIREHVQDMVTPYYIQYDQYAECMRDDNMRYKELLKNRSLQYVKNYNKTVADNFFEEWQLTLPEFKACFDYRIKAFKKEFDQNLRDEISGIIQNKYKFAKGTEPEFSYDRPIRLWCLDTKNHGVKFFAKDLESLKQDVLRITSYK